MSKEIDDLLEINSEENLNYKNNKTQNFAQHFLIHLGILVGLIAISYTMIENNNSSNDVLLVGFIFAILFLVFFVVLVVEAIYYQIKNKFQLRNSALVLILLFFMTLVGIVFSLGI
jgi:uncharacterized membrane protein YagU involved in acid resistance